MGPELRPELLELIWKARDGALTLDEKNRLEALVIADEDARQVYLECLDLMAGLHWSIGDHDMAVTIVRTHSTRDSATQGGELVSLRQTDRDSSSHGDRRLAAHLLSLGRRVSAMPFAWLSRPTPLSLLVASVLIASLLWGLALWTLPGARSTVVAEVILARGVRWSPASLVEGRPPSNLSIGQNIKLLQGTVALRFDSGALVLLEGPAEFSSSHRNQLQLRRGRLAARVPPAAAGFLVRTPTVDIVDLGTAFTLDVSAAETEVQVLTGNVQVRSHDMSREPPRMLASGEAAVFGSSSTQGFYTQEKQMNRAIYAGMMATLAMIGTTAHAAPMTPVGVPYSSGAPYPSGFPVGGGPWLASYAIDGNLATTAVLLTDTSTGTGGTPTVPTNPGGNTTGHMVFDLGDTLKVSGVTLWARNVSGTYNPNSVDFFYFADNDPTNNALVDDIAGDSDIILLTSVSFNALNNNNSQSFVIPDFVGRYVGMRVNSSYEQGGSGVHWNFQIAEIAFEATAVPEPLSLSVWTMLSAATACMTYISWRRRANRRN